MDHEFRSIVERLAILEGRIAAPAKKVVVAEPPSALLKPQQVVEARADKEVAEDVLDKVKASFADYLTSIEDKIKKDTDLKSKGEVDQDLKKKEKKDRDLVAKEKSTEEVEESSVPVKTITLEDEGLWEIHGNEHDGFKVCCNGRSTKSRFATLDEAELALNVFADRRRAQRQAEATADYIEEK